MTPDLLSGLWAAPVAPRLSAREWEALLGQARSARLLARLARHFERRGWHHTVPARVWRHLATELRQAQVLRHDVLQEIDWIACALKAVDTPVVLLKGAAYVAGRLPAGEQRLFSDIDILVRADRLREVEGALFAAGWLPEKLTPYDDRYYRQWMHELPPLQHVHRHGFLDVHHTIAPPTSRFQVDGAALLARSVPLAGHAQLRVLAPADMLLHSVLHLMQDGEFATGLRDLLDMHDLLLHFGGDEAFRQDLRLRARELGLEAVWSQVQAQIDRLFGTQALAGLESERQPARGRWRDRLLARSLTLALTPAHPSCNTPRIAAARWLMYVRSHWLRMPWYQILGHLTRKAWMRALHRAERVGRDGET